MMLKPKLKSKAVIMITLNFLSIILVLKVIIPEINIITALIGSRNIIIKYNPIKANWFNTIIWFIHEISKRLIINKVIVIKTFKTTDRNKRSCFFLSFINLFYPNLIIIDILKSKI